MSEASSYLLNVEDLLWPGAVTLISSFQLAEFAKRVGAVRKKNKIPFPDTTGDPNFNRAFRAQMNTLEFHPIFMSCLWVTSIFFHPGIASAVGLVYIYSRHNYFVGYCKRVEDRVSGFHLGVNCLKPYLLMGVSGLLTVGLRKYTGIDLSEIVFSYVKKALPWK